jgi:peptidoglycan/xylan/chitin deacetylase (PgdA/CDA1 family)
MSLVKPLSARATARLLAFVLLCAAKVNAADLTVLTYHDVVADPGKDFYAVSRSMFVAHMDYLQTNGYRVISLADIERYKNRPGGFPDKSVLITFDDGLRSYYEFIVPVMRIYDYPSVLSIVTGWLDGKNVPPEYHNKLMTWEQVSELSRDPLVAIASHSHDLHHGIKGDPQGSEAAASITRQYFSRKQDYESEAMFAERIRADLNHSIDRIKEELEITVNAVTWPYGLYDNTISAIASDLGLAYQFSLDDGPTPTSRLPRINRVMLFDSDNIGDFAAEFTYTHLATQKRRFARIDLQAYTGAKTIDQQEAVLSKLLDRLEPLGLNMIVITPFNTQGDAAYFHTSQMPVAADVLKRLVHQLKGRLGIRHILVQAPAKLKTQSLPLLYKDLARLVPFDGVVFEPGFEPMQAKVIAAAVAKYRPDVKLGVLGTNNSVAEFAEFIIAPVNTNANLETLQSELNRLKGNPKKVYVMPAEAASLKDNDALLRIQVFTELDVRHFGIQLNTANLVKLNSKGTKDVTDTAQRSGG